MSKWKQTSAQDKANVINAKIENPDLSTRDIEEKTGVNYSTASRVIKTDLQQLATKSERIAELVDINMEIIIDWKKLLLEDVKTRERKSWNDNWIVDRIVENSVKQNELFWMTDEQKENAIYNIDF